MGINNHVPHIHFRTLRNMVLGLPFRLQRPRKTYRDQQWTTNHCIRNSGSSSSQWSASGNFLSEQTAATETLLLWYRSLMNSKCTLKHTLIIQMKKSQNSFYETRLRYGSSFLVKVAVASSAGNNSITLIYHEPKTLYTHSHENLH